MNTQFRKGVIEMCVLALIDRKDMYGYEIVQSIAFYTEINEGTVYPILRRLETAEMLTVRTAEHNGRLRKYYHLTPQGLARIEQFKTEWEQIVNIYQFILSTEGTEHDES